METPRPQTWTGPCLDCWPGAHSEWPTGEHGEPTGLPLRAEVAASRAAPPGTVALGCTHARCPRESAHALCIRAPCSHLREETRHTEASGSPDVSGLWGAPGFLSGTKPLSLGSQRAAGVLPCVPM